ncbi:DUF4062 domain-containing protein [Oceanobacillus sojae]|uniref:DUF4062 domain-containing protein n=1 Tax=Oceanobacillus sojae TaxID=582851 RepID=UPI0021A25F34|nr:DUF4062 domain-containing protein [Oceanobacillus sojae]MCT1903532.1 DUF4062 domain-containing protein [Oceanobacillus sojae]
MEKKFQVFVSSTFTDLQEERQAAVSSILNAGHIPAGMELFKAGDESQKETIKRWIEESDIYMLILGGRYGTVDNDLGKSYTHWEYEYAGELGKPRFSIVIEENALEEKARIIGSHVMERENYPQYKKFREEVLSKISKFFSDLKDIKITVLESLKEYERDSSLAGWISGKDIENHKKILKENHDLLFEVTKLRKENEVLNEKLKIKNEIDGFSYEEVINYLQETEIRIPDDFPLQNVAGESMSLLSLLLTYKELLLIGIENISNMTKGRKFIFFKVAPKLMVFNLVEKVKVTGKTYQRLQLSKTGIKFITIYETRKDIE